MRIKVIGKGEVFKKHHLPAIQKLGLELVEENPEIIAICTPNYLHVPLSLYAVKKAKYVILEKPIATNIEDAEMLLDCEQIAVCYQRRFDSQAQKIKKIKQKPISVDCQMFVRRDKNYWQTWRSDKEKSGGGALINIFIHYFDLLQWWLGSEYQVTFARIAEREGVDQSIYAELDFKGVKVRFQGSSLHSSRQNKIVLNYKDHKIVYDKEDATHFDVYDQFLNHNNKISVEEAIVSLKIAKDIYYVNQNC